MSRRGTKGPRNGLEARPRVRRDGYDGAFVPRQQFTVDMRIRRQAVDVLRGPVTAARWPLVLDAIEAAAWPVETYLGPYVRAGFEVVEYLEDNTHVGETLRKFASATGRTVDELARRPHEKMGFWFGDDKPDTYQPGDLPFEKLRILYYGYFALRAATVDRYAYFATPEMTALVEAGRAADSGFGVAVTMADLPSTRGAVYLSPPDGVTDHGRVLTWNVSGRDTRSRTDVLHLSMLTVPALRLWLGTYDGSFRENMLLERFVNDYLPQPPLSEVELSPVDSDQPPSPPARTGGLKYKEEIPDQPIDSFLALHDPDFIAGTFFALVNMLRGNKFVESSPRQAGRMRRGDGTVVRMSDVTYLSYRQPRAPKSDTSDGAGRLSKRHVVRGHWRRHWYPSQNRHLPLWIDEHLQGPAEAPIEVRTKVTVVRPPGDGDRP